LRGVQGGGFLEKSPPDRRRHPSARGPYKKIYKTGDLARWLPDGMIECLGRIDRQVKIRGFRIELGEIESLLLKHETIKAALVTAPEDENGNNYLLAYIVVESEGSTDSISLSGLRHYLAQNLPDYLVPSHFVQIGKIPLTPNGKVDMRALAQSHGSVLRGGQYIEPGNSVERILAQIWQKILKVEKVGVYDDFFQLGGNSIKIIELASEINKKFNKDITITQLIKNSRLQQVSAYIASEYIESEEEPFLLLNKVKPRKIYCFPSIFGYGLEFLEFSFAAKNWAVCAFNYLEEEDKIARYAELITGIPPGGGYILLGYSGGGYLAFIVAKELERRGCHVQHIILLDSLSSKLKKGESQKLDKQIEQSQPQMLPREHEAGEFINRAIAKQKIKEKNYIEYTFEFINSRNIGVVNANIHLITSSEYDKERQYLVDWSKATSGSYVIHNGFGKHSQMLSPGYIEQNISIIEKILS
jgi:thioesterase domain-containing protein/acyl carrier protein